MTFIVCIVACKDEPMKLPPVDTSFVGEWKFEAFEIPGDTIIRVTPRDSIFLILYDNGRVHGTSQGLCWNYFDGFYRVGPNKSLQFESLYETALACIYSLYDHYFDSLHTVYSYDTGDTTLFLFYGTHNSKMNFIRKR